MPNGPTHFPAREAGRDGLRSRMVPALGHTMCGGFLWVLVLGALLPGLAAAQATTMTPQPSEYTEVQRLLNAGDPAAALPRADAYLQANPRDPQMRLLRALALADGGRTDEAIEAYTRLIQDYPELPEPYNNLAVLRASQDRLDEALALLLEALRARPSYATALDNLGDIHVRLALRAWQQARQADAAIASRTGAKAARVREALAAGAR